MTEYKQVLAIVEELERISNKSSVFYMLNLSEVALQAKFISWRKRVEVLRKKAQETDNNKKVFGPGMTQKVLALVERFNVL